MGDVKERAGRGGLIYRRERRKERHETAADMDMFVIKAFVVG